MPPAVLIQPVTCCLQNSPGEQQRLPVSCWTSFSLERGPHLPWFRVILLLGSLIREPLWPMEGKAVPMRLSHCALETEGKGTHSLTSPAGLVLNHTQQVWYQKQGGTETPAPRGQAFPSGAAVGEGAEGLGSSETTPAVKPVAIAEPAHSSSDPHI